jgi:uncharacterized protein
MEAYRQEAYRPQPFQPGPVPGSGPMQQMQGAVPGPGSYPGPGQGMSQGMGQAMGQGMGPGMSPAQVPNGLDWLLDDLVNRVAHIEKAVILSQDGIALGASRGLEQADAEHLAALAAGFQSLARGAGRHFGGGTVRQTIIEMETGFLFVTSAGNGTCLAVLTHGGADVGLVAYEMAVLVQRTGEHLQTGLRGVPAGNFDT